MPKAVILFSFKRDDPSPLLKNLSDLTFNRKDGRRTIFSKEFSVNEVELELDQLKAVKDSITKNATIRIASPSRVWKEAFKAAGLDSDEAVALAGLAMAEPGTTSSVNLLDFGDSSMGEAAIPEAKAPVATELKQEESQSQGIVDDDFDVDALVAGLVNTKIGGRTTRVLDTRRRKTRSTRTFTVRRGGKKSRSKSRRH
jgi:hypothetical protein